MLESSRILQSLGGGVNAMCHEGWAGPRKSLWDYDRIKEVVHFPPRTKGTPMTSLARSLQGITRFYDSSRRLKLGVPKRETSTRDSTHRTAYILDCSINTEPDPLKVLCDAANEITSRDALLIVLENSYRSYLASLVRSLFFSKPEVGARNFLTRRNLCLIARLAELEVVDFRIIPRWRIFALVPLLRWLSIHTIAILKKRPTVRTLPSTSVIVPVRNEAGNVARIFKGLAELKLEPRMEIIFVEGGSTDGTWEELHKTAAAFPTLETRILKQDGRGKADAVRKGFAAATQELLMILDGDLSVEVKDLRSFHEAYCRGDADLLIGTRLLFPFESGAMRPLNFLGNLFFAKIVSLLFNLEVTDMLCGTKVISRSDYARVRAWRDAFRFRDPFGDFELIFAMAAMGLAIQEIPVRYKARVYGTTNISRFRDGLELIIMTLRARLIRD